MSNRTLFYLCIIAIVAIITLFLVDIRNIGQYTSAYPEVYLKHNDVSGISVEIDQDLYTLNFEQQNSVINIINRSLPVAQVKNISEKPDFQKLIIYQFEKKPEIIITPVGYGKDGDLTYSSPTLEPEGYLMEVSEGELKDIIQSVHRSNPS